MHWKLIRKSTSSNKGYIEKFYLDVSVSVIKYSLCLWYSWGTQIFLVILLSKKSKENQKAPVAQLDRAPDYGTDNDFLKIHG